MPAQIGDKARNIVVSEWVQGRPTNIDKGEMWSLLKYSKSIVQAVSHMGSHKQ
jgi:hypothetical protein